MSTLKEVRTRLIDKAGSLSRNDRDAMANCRFMRQEHEAGRVPDYEKLLALGYGRFLAPGSVVVDVGAHVGLHLKHFAILVGPRGRVLAFEPLPGCFSVLESAKFGPNVALFKVALSNVKGVAEFVFAQGTPQESGLRQRIYNNPELANPVRIEVETERLDDLTAALERLDFIKIDAEGGEILILEGAVETLRRLRPLVSVEYGRPSYSAYGNSAETLYRFAGANSYVICDLFGGAITKLGTWLSVCDQAYWDWYLIPKESLVAWQDCMKPLADIERVVRRS